MKSIDLEKEKKEIINKYRALLRACNDKTNKEDKKNIRTFASYEQNEELFSDRNVFPIGCIVKMEKINEK